MARNRDIGSLYANFKAAFEPPNFKGLDGSQWAGLNSTEVWANAVNNWKTAGNANTQANLNISSQDTITQLLVRQDLISPALNERF